MDSGDILSAQPDIVRIDVVARDPTTKEVKIVAYCHVGVRSTSAVAILRQVGYPNVRNLKGGIDAWAEQVDPEMPRY